MVPVTVMLVPGEATMLPLTAVRVSKKRKVVPAMEPDINCM